MKPGAAIAVLLVIAVFVYAFAVNWRQYAHPTIATSTPEAAIQYTSDAAGISFAYPPHLQVSSQIDGNAERNWPVITLMDKTAAANIPPNSEAPPAITIAAYPNPENTPLQKWVADMIEKNSGSPASSTSAVVAGEPGLRFQLTGLYESDVVAVAHGGKMYVFSVAWGAASDTLREEFDDLIKTVTFL